MDLFCAWMHKCTLIIKLRASGIRWDQWITSKISNHPAKEDMKRWQIYQPLCRYFSYRPLVFSQKYLKLWQITYYFPLFQYFSTVCVHEENMPKSWRERRDKNSWKEFDFSSREDVTESVRCDRVLLFEPETKEEMIHYCFGNGVTAHWLRYSFPITLVNQMWAKPVLGWGSDWWVSSAVVQAAEKTQLVLDGR